MYNVINITVLSEPSHLSEVLFAGCPTILKRWRLLELFVKRRYLVDLSTQTKGDRGRLRIIGSGGRVDRYGCTILCVCVRACVCVSNLKFISC